VLTEFAQLSTQNVSAELGKTAKSNQKAESTDSGGAAQSSSFFDVLESAKKKADLETVVREIQEKIRNGELKAKEVAEEIRIVKKFLEKASLEKASLDQGFFDNLTLKQLKQFIERAVSKDNGARRAEHAKGGKAETEEQTFLGLTVKDLQAIISSQDITAERNASSAGESFAAGKEKTPVEVRGNGSDAESAQKAGFDKKGPDGTKIIYLEVSDKDKAGNLKELNKVKENLRGSRTEAGEHAGKKGGRTPSVTVIDKRGNENGESAGFKNAQGGLHSSNSSNGNETSLGKGEFNQSEQFGFDFKTESSAARQGVFSRGAVTGEEQSNLLKFLKGSANGEIVKQAGIILKNNNSGEIRLVLKPEKLGNVRIKLNLQDNNIVGKIIVENINVKEVFEHNLESLHRAFRQEGFQSSGLEVSVGGGEQKGEGKEEAKSFAGRKAEHGIGDDHSAAVQQYYGYEEGIVNLVV
jgi:flagellar hook-length control protein FliK